MSLRHATAALALGMTMLAPAAASADIQARVRFAGPYSSWDFRSSAERDRIGAELARFLEREGRRMLPPGRDASVEILSVKPAGRLDPFGAGISQPRILTDVTPPRVTLRYVARERGRIVARGEEAITDLNYLWNPAARLSSDSLAYEKALLRDWVRDRLVRLKPAR